MSHTAIWIDHKKAVILDFSGKGVQERVIEAHGKNQDEEHQKKFYHEVASSLNNADKIMIMGPGMAKDEFKRHCNTHNHKQVMDKIVGTESMKDHPSHAEVLKKAEAFYTKYFQWNGILTNRN